MDTAAVMRFLRAIDRVYRDANVACRVCQSPGAVVITPLEVSFRLELGSVGGTKQLAMDAKAGRIEAELNERLGVIFNSIATEVNTGPLVSFRDAPLRLVIPYPGSLQPVTWNRHFLGTVNAVPLGVSYTTTGSAVAMWNRQANAHLLVCGATGSGKSMLLQGILLSIATYSSPADTEFLTMDFKRRAFLPFERLGHNWHGCIWDVAVGRRYLSDLNQELDKRIQNGRNQPTIFLAIDELSDLLEGHKETQDAFFRVVRLGRELGVFVLAGIQKPLVSVMGNGKSQMLGVVVGRMRDSRDAATAAGQSLPAHMLRHPGLFYKVGGGQPILFQSWYLAPETLESQITIINNRHDFERPSSALSCDTVEVHTGDDVKALAMLKATFGDDDWRAASLRQKVLALGYSDGGNSYQAGKRLVMQLEAA